MAFSLPPDLFEPVLSDDNMDYVVDTIMSAFHHVRLKVGSERVFVTGAYAIRPHPDIPLFPKYPCADLMRQYTTLDLSQPQVELLIEMNWDETSSQFKLHKNMFDLTIYVGNQGETTNTHIYHNDVDKAYIVELIRYCVGRRAIFTFEFNSNY